MKPFLTSAAKYRWALVLCSIALVALAVFWLCVRGSYRNKLDVTLDGPWILYQDTQFDNYGKKVPVLIAIAPAGVAADDSYTNHTMTATDATDVTDTTDYVHHHWPQVSSGDGYYIKKAGIYCFTFDSKCAPKAGVALTSKGYRRAVPLTMAFHDENDNSPSWDWVSPSKSSKSIALILPMPDSYSNDGIWHMRFGKSFSGDGSKYGGDTKHSIGLHLHYHNGPNTFGLLSCNDGVSPSVANCKNRATGISHTQVHNSGTLRIEMRAPDDDFGCDCHVRYAYQQMFALVNNDYDKDFGYIEPAQVNADGTIYYDNANDHYCLDRDPQNPHNSKDPQNPYASSCAPPNKTTASRMSHSSNTNPSLTDQLNTIIGNIMNLPKGQDLTSILPPVERAQKLSRDLDPNFLGFRSCKK